MSIEAGWLLKLPLPLEPHFPYTVRFIPDTLCGVSPLPGSVPRCYTGSNVSRLLRGLSVSYSASRFTHHISRDSASSIIPAWAQSGTAPRKGERPESRQIYTTRCVGRVVGHIHLCSKEVSMLHRTARIAACLSVFVLLLTTLLARPEAPASAAGVEMAPAAPQAGGSLSIPFSQVLPQLDGDCGDYAGAAVQSFADGGGHTGTVFLKHDSTNLYVCMKASPGTFKDRFGSLYLDPQGDGANYEFAQKDDYALHVNIPGTTKSSFNGTGVANGYVPNA